MTLLEILRESFSRLGLAAPTAAAQTSDVQGLQAVALLNEELASLRADPHPWAALNAEFTITGVSGQSLYSFPADWDHQVNSTQWNRSQRFSVIGPVSGIQWQRSKAAIGVRWPRMHTRLRATGIEFLSEPGAGSIYACEYQKNTPVLNGSTAKERFTDDTDTCVFDDELMVRALKWRWLRAKGLNYQHEYDEHMLKLDELRGRDMGAASLTLTPSEGWSLLDEGNYPFNVQT